MKIYPPEIASSLYYLWIVAWLVINDVVPELPIINSIENDSRVTTFSTNFSFVSYKNAHKTQEFRTNGYFHNVKLQHAP